MNGTLGPDRSRDSDNLGNDRVGKYVPLADIVVDERLGYIEELVEILDTVVKKLRRKEIFLFKADGSIERG
uniref:Reverse transcriptase domain-containing protein n=1 Tax=Tanacetum cinerariifolium TaxID=118510 RepID=A0A699Q9U5_TANCI|nr:reverse transcriptase domain-containing protein [Tanacetum cinerariifolium]